MQIPKALIAAASWTNYRLSGNYPENGVLSGLAATRELRDAEVLSAISTRSRLDVQVLGSSEISSCEHLFRRLKTSLDSEAYGSVNTGQLWVSLQGLDCFNPDDQRGTPTWDGQMLHSFGASSKRRREVN